MAQANFRQRISAKLINLTAEGARSPGSYCNAEGLTGQSICLYCLAECGDIIPVAAHVVDTAVHKGCGIDNSSAIPERSVRFVDEPTVVRAKVKGFCDRVTHAAVLGAAIGTPPVWVLSSPTAP